MLKLINVNLTIVIEIMREVSLNMYNIDVTALGLRILHKVRFTRLVLYFASI